MMQPILMKFQLSGVSLKDVASLGSYRRRQGSKGSDLCFLPTGGGAYGDVIPFPEIPRVYVSARMGWGSL